MSKRLVLVAVVAMVALVLVGVTAGCGLFERSGQAEPGTLGMPAPGFESKPEMIVGGEEDGGTVSSGMPVPGYADVPEMIIIEE